ncbi:hypothetical protein SLA2020_061670 [Shorea laevis]
MKNGDANRSYTCIWDRGLYIEDSRPQLKVGRLSDEISSWDLSHTLMRDGHSSPLPCHLRSAYLLMAAATCHHLVNCLSTLLHSIPRLKPYSPSKRTL